MSIREIAVVRLVPGGGGPPANGVRLSPIGAIDVTSCAARNRTPPDRRATSTMPTSPHPLDPLRAEEVSRAVALIREGHASGDQWLFASVELVEPAKSAFAEWKPGEPFAR